MTDSPAEEVADRGEIIERHGNAEPLETADMYAVWPTCFAYIRGRDPSRAEILAVRGLMVDSCLRERLYLRCIFHDLDVEPTSFDYPSFWEFNHALNIVPTHSVYLADLELVREPSSVLVTIATGLSSLHPGVRIHTFVQPEFLDEAPQPGQ